MGNRIQRITNGQRAAICGLLLAGVPFKTGCAVVDVPYKAMLRHVPRDYRGVAKARKWRGELLFDLRDAYLNRTMSWSRICADFNLIDSHLAHLAKSNNWPPRRLIPRARKVRPREQLEERV